MSDEKYLTRAEFEEYVEKIETEKRKEKANTEYWLSSLVIGLGFIPVMAAFYGLSFLIIALVPSQLTKGIIGLIVLVLGIVVYFLYLYFARRLINKISASPDMLEICKKTE